VQSGPLGTDYNAAVSRAETILLPAFDAGRTGGDTAAQASSSATIAIGALDWLFAEYRADRRFAKLDPKSKRNHEVGFKLVGGYVLKDGKRLGEKRLTAIDTALIDDLYEKLLILWTTDANGNVVERERRTTVNHAMKSCRRAWNVVARRTPASCRLLIPSRGWAFVHPIARHPPRPMKSYLPSGLRQLSLACNRSRPLR
jgi:hypothetical protein